MGSCTLVKTNRGRFLNDTLPYIENILAYLKNTLFLSFNEFICDFIKDE